jgi:hypothetical protein
MKGIEMCVANGACVTQNQPTKNDDTTTATTTQQHNR